MRQPLVCPCRRDGPAANIRRRPMAAIGFVNGTIEGGFVGQLKTLSIRAAIEIRTNRSKNGDVQPDYRVYSEGVEIGAGWVRTGEASGKPYVSLTLAAPEIGPRGTYDNLGGAAGKDGEEGIGTTSCRARVWHYV